MSHLYELLSNLDENLQKAIEQYGAWVYIIGCVVIFCETGLIFFAILPGDSLLFAAGSMAAAGHLNTTLIMIAFPLAAFLGDQANFLLGEIFGRRLFYKSKLPFFNEKNLQRTEKFYEEHGATTVIIGRFVPIVRSLSPFVAAASQMKYFTFLRYSVPGVAMWSYLFLLLGYFFGQIPFVEQNLWMVITGVVLLTIIPGIIKYIRITRSKAK